MTGNIALRNTMVRRFVLVLAGGVTALALVVSGAGIPVAALGSSAHRTVPRVHGPGTPRTPMCLACVE